MKHEKLRLYIGWITVALSTLFSGLWAFWGTIENFHEGWYSTSLWENIGLLLIQYWSIMIAFMTIGLIALRWRIAGLALYAGIAVFAMWFFHSANENVLIPFIVLPLILMGLGFFWGTPNPRKYAYYLQAGLPALVVLGCLIEPVYRVSTRVDDGNRGMRRVEVGTVKLYWAPQGPGWPDGGIDWYEAQRRCAYLSEDGTRLEDHPVNIWRLPTIEEVVQSQHRRGKPAGGIWNPQTQKATYAITPDKEPPLWNPYSKVIYWWTATEIPNNRALRVVYNQWVVGTPKMARWGYLGFRAVKPIPEPTTKKP